jgi:phosphopantetheinyl transferase
MIDEANRVSTVLDFHLTEARKLVERLESLEEIAVEQGAATRLRRQSWKRTEFQEDDLRRLLTLGGQRQVLKKYLGRTLRAVRGK